MITDSVNDIAETEIKKIYLRFLLKLLKSYAQKAS